MAGIGFELKKIYKKEGISRAIAGGLYSSVVTLGPTIIVITTILLLYLFLDMTNVGMYERELLSNTILYIFIFSGIFTYPFATVFSRYLADKFYLQEYNNILASYYVGLIMTGVVAMVTGIPVLVTMYFKGNIDLPFIISAYFLWISAMTLFFSIIYIHTTKNYKLVTMFFLVALLIGGFAAYYLFKYTYWDQIHCILYGLTIAFSLISISEFVYIRLHFKNSFQNYSDCIKYFFKYKNVFGTSLFYILGMYIHNIVFWNAPSRILISDTFISNPSYDMASFLGIFTSISTTVIFTVTAETSFHTTYQHYSDSIVAGTYKMIQKNKKIMFRTMSQMISKVFNLQMAITSLAFMLIIIFGKRIGFSTLTITIYPMLAIGFLIAFIMYCNIVYLFYFEDLTGALLSGLIFFLGTLGGSLVSTGFQPSLYGMGLIIGSVLAWCFSFFRLRWLERNFEAHIFCGYKIINTMKSSAKGVIVYSKEE